MAITIQPEVADVLGNSRIEGSRLFLPDYQLERVLYLQVDKVLKALGGKWNRKEKAHLFESDPSDKVEEALQTGNVTNQKQAFDFFETPPDLADRLVALAQIRPNERVCEPSAGRGAILSRLPIDSLAVELMPENRAYLGEHLPGYRLAGRDFMSCYMNSDVFVANPPFSKQQDIDHVNHMIDMCKRRVVSVMSAGVLFRTNKKTVDFRERVELYGGEFIELDPGTFKDSGTMVNAVICVVDVS